MKNSIGIIGCGWLGFPLAKSFIKDGNNVHGSTTNKDKLDLLQEAGINPFIIILGEDAVSGPIEEFLDRVDILILNIPPRLRGTHKENFVHKMNLLHAEIQKSNVQKILFVSSTSVYGAVEGEVTEETLPMPVTESGKQLVEAEKIFKNDNTIQTTILRFGGLIGPDRHPIDKLSGKKGLSNGNEPVNLIHLDDCIHLIRTIIENNWWGQIFNGVFPDHPLKKEYYNHMADKKMLPRPQYIPNKITKRGKIIISKNFLINNVRFYTGLKV